MRLLLLTLLMSVFAVSPALAQRDQIRIVGSSTVYPFTATAAEHFGETGKFKTPVVESTGTGGGFKLICEGVGETTPDISNASRPITDKERELCKTNGIDLLVEIPIGYDGIVIANKKGATTMKLTKEQLFLALAKELPTKNGKLVANPNKKWKQVDKSLPDSEILVYGPPPTSGTRDAFAELVLEAGCEKQIEATGYKGFSDKKAQTHYCHTIREDGLYVDSGEDDNVIINKLTANDKALGIFGYSYYENNRAKIQAATIDGVAPSYENVESGEYAVSRSLFVYVKTNHMATVPGMMDFIRELTSKASIGEEGYNTEKGLLPLSAADRKEMLSRVAQLKASK